MGLSPDELRRQLLLAIEELIKLERFLVFTNVQHWLDEIAQPIDPFLAIIEHGIQMPSLRQRPLFLTSTRRISFSRDQGNGVNYLQLGPLPDEYMATLIRYWYDLAKGEDLSSASSLGLAEELHGHPVAAKWGANLAAQFGVDYLKTYPRDLVQLRRDLAKTLLQDLPLRESSRLRIKPLPERYLTEHVPDFCQVRPSEIVFPQPASTALMESLATVAVPIRAQVVAKGVGLAGC